MPCSQEEVSDMVNKHGTNDPFKLARSLGIVILFMELKGTYGYYRTYKRIKTIVINDKLDEWLKRYVCAHELGHAIYHHNINTAFLKKNTFYSIDKFEREANEFAIRLLLHDKDLQDYETKSEILQDNGIPSEMERFI